MRSSWAARSSDGGRLLRRARVSYGNAQSFTSLIGFMPRSFSASAEGEVLSTRRLRPTRFDSSSFIRFSRYPGEASISATTLLKSAAFLG